ncbi:hypothetical protein FB106_10275 [Synechococcus sp. Ace-Pa]|nr:hypothetical protein FB106_10275 [Synechococcus sp. Ace-Pa]
MGRRLQMYLLTIRDGLVTRHIGPFASPKHAADDLDRRLAGFGERVSWQIHELEAPEASLMQGLEQVAA